MTTLVIDKGIDLPKTHFKNIEELYLMLQEQLTFESHLQNKAKIAMNINEYELIDF